MGKGLYKFLINISIIVIGMLIVLVTSTLLELNFFKEMLVRELIVYLVIIIQLFVTFRVIYLLNKNEPWMKSRK